ncbi:MAG: hypothetical protein CMJ65_02835 [Planctomycetaceae bacterium]|nr:hypothetical protein [Planctomycetaceae bacterium]
MPVLAADIDVVPVIIGVIALISWLTNKAKEAQRAGGAEVGDGDANAGRGGGKVQAEIDRFLREVGGGRKRREEAADDPVVLIADEPESPRKRSGSLRERHAIGNRHLDSNVQAHVEDHMRSGRIDEQVEHDLGTMPESAMGGSVTSVRGGQVTTEDLVGMLTRPEDVQRAVLVHEILAPPKGRRVRRGR